MFLFVQDEVTVQAYFQVYGLTLDSQTTVGVFVNKKLLKNIHDAKRPLTLHWHARVNNLP